MQKKTFKNTKTDIAQKLKCHPNLNITKTKNITKPEVIIDMKYHQLRPDLSFIVIELNLSN